MEIRVIVILKNFRYFLRFTDADFFVSQLVRPYRWKWLVIGRMLV